MRGLLFTVFLVFLSFPAFAGGRVTDLKEKHTYLGLETYLSEIEFTIELNGPAPLWVEYFKCGEEIINPEVFPGASGPIEVLRLEKNGEPVKPVKFPFSGLHDFNTSCTPGPNDSTGIRISLEDPFRLYPSGTYHFSIVVIQTAHLEEQEDLKTFGAFFGDWVDKQYIIEKAAGELVLPKGNVVQDFFATTSLNFGLLQLGARGEKIVNAFKTEKVADNHYRFSTTMPLEPLKNIFAGMVLFEDANQEPAELPQKTATLPPPLVYGTLHSWERGIFFLSAYFKNQAMVVLNYFGLIFVLLYFLTAGFFTFRVPKFRTLDYGRGTERQTQPTPGAGAYWGLAVGFVISAFLIFVSVYISPFRSLTYYLLLLAYFVVALFKGYQFYARVDRSKLSQKMTKAFLILGPIGFLIWDFFNDFLLESEESHLLRYDIWEMVPFIGIILINLLYFITLEKRVSR